MLFLRMRKIRRAQKGGARLIMVSRCTLHSVVELVFAGLDVSAFFFFFFLKPALSWPGCANSHHIYYSMHILPTFGKLSSTFA